MNTMAETPSGAWQRPPSSTSTSADHDHALRQLVVDLSAIDRVTGVYHAKREGRATWSTFEIPASLRVAA